MDDEERVGLIRAGAVLGYMWCSRGEQDETAKLSVLLDIVDKLLSSAADAGLLGECAIALDALARFLRQFGDLEQTRMADEVCTRIIQIATRASGPGLLEELCKLPDDLAAAGETVGEFD